MNRRLVLFGVMSAVALVAALIVALPAGASTFTVSPWAYACSTTHTGNPASNTDPGPTCDHNGAEAGLGTGYCPDGSGSTPDSAGTVMSSYVSGKLTLTKTGPQCDDMAPGASIGGLVTLTAASADCLTDTCNPGGNLRLNVFTTANGNNPTFVGGTQDAAGHITFTIPEGGFTGVTEIDIIADAVANNEASTVVIDNLSFTGSAPPNPCVTPSPTQSASPSPSEQPSPSPSPSEEPSPSPSPSEEPSPSPSPSETATISTLAFVQATCPTARPTPKPPTTGVGYPNGNQTPPAFWILALFAVVAINGGLFLFTRRK